MLAQSWLSALTLVTLASAQTLTIPQRNGAIQTLTAPSTIPSGQSRDFANREYERNIKCDTDEDLGPQGAVFILQDGASLSNVIIGVNQREGVHCNGACTLRNVWFRDVCEDAISVLGSGNALIQGGGAQEASDKVIQHNGRGTVTVRDFTVVNAGKLYRACGDCTNNGGPRNINVDNVRARNVPELVGINSNYGDRANVTNSCGSGVNRACQEWRGVEKGNGKSEKVSTTSACRGQVFALPSC